MLTSWVSVFSINNNIRLEMLPNLGDKMNSALVFVALLGLAFANGLPGGKSQLSESKIKELLAEDGAFSAGLNVAIGKLNNGNGKYR